MQKPQTQPFGDFAAVVISSQGLSPAGCSRHLHTHRSIKSWSQVRDEHLWVDGLEVPGEVLAVELFPQLAPVCNVTIRLLSTKSREKIKLTSEASKEKNKKQKNPPEPGLRAEGSSRLCHHPSQCAQDPDWWWGLARHPQPPAGTLRLEPLIERAGTFWHNSTTLWCCKKKKKKIEQLMFFY